MPRCFDRPFRLALAAAAMVLTAVPAVPAFAQGQCMSGCGAANPVMNTGSKVLDVDIPAPNALIRNGDMVDVGGWTAGTRVDVYLDGPAGFGEGIGSTEVDKPRPDVARVTGDAGLAESGFDVPWAPIELTAGPHTLYVYSLVNGAWSWQTLPILGEGNQVIDLDRERGGDRGTDLDTTENGAAVTP